MTFVEEAVISGFISKVINNCVDISWIKIKKVVENRKNKHTNIESQIYNIIVDVLNQITNNKYKNNQNKIYQAAEKLLLGYKDDKFDNLEAMRSCMQILDECVNDDKYMEFKTLLYQEIGKNDYEELYRQIRLLQQDEESSKASRIEEKVDRVQQSVDETNRRLDAFQESNRGADIVQNKEPAKSRTQEYDDKWNANMFLNDFSKWDENAGVYVKLSDVYIEEHLPHFVWGSNENVSNNLKNLLYEYIVKKDKNKMLLILGQPGIGKSTLITWIVANFKNKKDDILVFRFVSDLKSIVWRANLLNQIVNVLNLSHQELEGKILILDGYDEISIDKRGEVLNNLYEELTKEKKIKKLNIIITCRENYINNLTILRCEYITLQLWNKDQIRSFCKVWQIKTRSVVPDNMIIKVINNYPVFGIPIILYITLALNVLIDKENALVDLYDQVFSINGGIYDRAIANIKYEYSHRIGDFKQQIHEVSKKMALWMFENNSEEAIIPESEYRIICQSVIKENELIQELDKQDFIIGNFFKYHLGNETRQIYFVHRTMYEYFVVEAIYESIESAIRELSEDSQDILAGNIAYYLKEGQLSRTISDYLMRKILNLYNELSNEKKCKFYNWWEGAINKMMENGMFFYTNKNIHNYKSIITKEANCFLNITEILRKIAFYITPRRYIMEYVNSGRLERYIRHCCLEYEKCDFSFFNLGGIELMGIDLAQINFIGANLNGIDLQNENLKGALLQGANLKGSNLRGADLERADLEDATLKFASLVSANLSGANLSGANLFQVDLRHANLRRAILNNTELDATKWCRDELNKLRLQIKQAKFTYVVVEGNESTKIYRNELFPEENEVCFN